MPHNDIPAEIPSNDLDSEQTLTVPEVENDEPKDREQKIASEENVNIE